MTHVPSIRENEHRARVREKIEEVVEAEMGTGLGIEWMVDELREAYEESERQANSDDQNGR